MPQELSVAGAFSDVMVITELRGSYPNVPLAADVDFAALTAGDANPTFLTLPIGKVGVTSRNKRHYDAAFVNELERQTLALKPVGLMGHLPEDQRAWAMPPEALHWVGAMQFGEFLWGKAYVVPGEVRERINRYRAQGKSLATSIDAHADGAWDESLGAYRMEAKTLRLGQIDIAPADRAGIPDLAAVPLLTSEMEQPGDEAEQEPAMDKLQMIRELTAEDAVYLPPAVREEVMKGATPAPEIALVQEIRSALGVESDADLRASVSALVTERADIQKAAIKTRIIELATPDPTRQDDKAIKVDSVRAVVVEMVNARHPSTVQEAESFYNEVAASQLVGDLLKTTLSKQMGPNQRVPVPSQSETAKYFPIPSGE